VLIKYIKSNIKGKEAEMKKADLFIQKAEGMFQKGSFEAADKFAQQAQRVIEGLEHPNLAQFMFVFRQLQAAELVSNAREEFSRIKRAMPNVELAPAEELLRNAEKAFDSDAAFDESKEMVLQAKIMALEIEQGAQEGNANNELTMLHSLILQKKKENKDVSGLIKDYETAKAAFDGKDYKKCLAFVRKAKTAAGVG
jgi:hypothetical protein